MASNVGITLAQIRAGTAVYQTDENNSVPGVAAVQKALKLLGYYPIDTSNYDGKMGSATVSAVKGLQTENKLAVSGTVDKQTLAFIDSKLITIYTDHSSMPTPEAIRCGFDFAKVGCSGRGVNQIRSLLISQGYSVATSGAFDDEMEKKVIAFQSSHHLGNDGLVGQKTYLALQNTTSSTGWINSSGVVNLTEGLLAQCGFEGVLLNFYKSQLNTAINSLSKANAKDLADKKEIVKQFLAQAMDECCSGRVLVESIYRAGTTGTAKYAPYYGAGVIQLTGIDNYTDFKKAKHPSDEKILSPADYATQHVAINYPAESGAWFWNTFVASAITNWKGDSKSICTTITKIVKNSTDVAGKRHEYYKNISQVLK